MHPIQVFKTAKNLMNLAIEKRLNDFIEKV